MDRLSDRCNQTLTIAAVVGREFALDQLKLLVGDLSEDQLLDIIEEALQAQVIDELPGLAAQYQFTHALIQETLAEELSLTRRVRLHARIAEALEELYGVQAEAYAAELAFHFAQAEAATGGEKLVYYSRIAGERALAAYGYEEALNHFQRALAVKESHPMDEETADLLFGLGRAQASLGEQLPEAVSSLTRAFDFYANIGDTEKAINVAEYPINSYPGFHTGVAHLLSRGLEIVPPESLQAGRLFSRLARALVLEEANYEAAQDAFNKALGITRREKDVRLEAQALANGAHANQQQLRYTEALELSLRSLRLAGEANDLWSECLAAQIATGMYMDFGNSEEVQRIGTIMLESARKLRSRYFVTSANASLGNLCFSTGNWERARTFYEEALSNLPGAPNILRRCAIVECQVGKFDQGDVFLNRLMELMNSWSQQGSLVFALAPLTVAEAASLGGKGSWVEVAESAARAHLSSSSATYFTSLAARAALALFGIARGQVTEIQEHYSKIASARQMLWGLCANRLLGLMAHTMGELDQAEQHFKDSLAYCRKAGYHPQLAWSCHGYAETLLQRNNPGDQEKARSLLNESLSQSTELDMRPLLQRVRERLRQLDPTAPNSPLYPDGLSQREVEVLNLIAQGKSNREIGEELVISEGTVRRHVNNIYDKTGLTNRAEATRYALEQNLASGN